MSIGAVFSTIHKIGDKVVEVITYPFRHSIALAHLLKDLKEDTPVTVAALVKLVKAFEQMTPDVLHVIADKGFDIPADIKAAADIKAVFQVLVSEVLPAIEHEFTELKANLADANMPDAAGAVPDLSGVTQAAQEIISAAPGLHNVTPA